MIVVLSDTHSDSGTELAGRAADAVAEADAVVHAVRTIGATLVKRHSSC